MYIVYVYFHFKQIYLVFKSNNYLYKISGQSIEMSRIFRHDSIYLNGKFSSNVKISKQHLCLQLNRYRNIVQMERMYIYQTL